MQIDSIIRRGLSLLATAVLLTGSFTVYAESNDNASPETGNTDISAYLVPAALAAVTVAAKKRNK